MPSFIFSILVYSSGIFASEVVPFPPDINQKALQLLEVFLQEDSKERADLIWNEIAAEEPSGLMYLDKVLQLVADESKWTFSNNEKRARLLSHIRKVVDITPLWISFDRSSIKKSLHASAQKILNRFDSPTYFNSDIVYIYHKLHLWEQSDLPFIIHKFFKDRSFAPLLIRFFSSGSSEIKKHFAARVRTRGQFEFVETGLLYQSGLLRDDEYIFLFRRLLDHAYFSELMATQMSTLYEDDSRVVESFEALLTEDLHERLHAKDPLIVALYNQLRDNPGHNERRPSSELQIQIYQRFLQSLWVGSPSGRCQFRLLKFGE